MLDSFLIIAAQFNDVRTYSLLFGLASLVAGITQMLNQRRGLEQAAVKTGDSRTRQFEIRKCRRRSLVGSLIASMGIMLAGLYWVRTPRVYSALLLMILALLMGILVIAMIDMFSVGFRSMTNTQADDPESLLKEYLKRKKSSEENQLGPTEDAD